MIRVRSSAITPSRRRDSGLTLIEMLVVLAIVGIAAGVTMLGLNSADRDARAEAEAVRLARNLSLSVDEAIVGGTPLALIWDAAGYRFVAWSEAGADWQAAAPNILAARHDLRAPLELSVQGWDQPAPVLIAASGIGPALAFVIAPATTNDSPQWIVDFDGFSATARPEGGT